MDQGPLLIPYKTLFRARLVDSNGNRVAGAVITDRKDCNCTSISVKVPNMPGTTLGSPKMEAAISRHNLAMSFPIASMAVTERRFTFLAGDMTESKFMG
jgi:hypothetical protein